MASCKQQSDCTAQEVCSDGQCVPVEVPEEREVRRTFATAAGEYRGQIKGEQQILDDLTEFITDELEEGEAERKEQEEDVGLWGTIGSIVGFGLGCFLGAGNPITCKTGAVVGASAGSLIGRTTADWMDPAEQYGLSDEEFAAMDPSQLKYLQGTYQKLVNDAEEYQADLDEYDDDAWKRHALGIIGDTWNAYKMASFGEVLWEGGKELLAKGGEEVVKDIAVGSTEASVPGIEIGTTLDLHLDRMEDLFPTSDGSSTTGWID